MMRSSNGFVVANITANYLDANDGEIGGLDVNGNLAMTGGGSITAGSVSISSSGLSAASGAVTIDANGLTLTAGSGTPNKINWESSTAEISASTGNTLNCFAGSTVTLETTSYYCRLGNTEAAFLPSTSSLTLGVSAGPWGDLYLSTHGSVVSKLSDLESRVSALENP